ncbi:restriction endonuclease subunit S [Candidatus Methanarcanum hacksteinii]|uniref:restriction endonuclease subunit S n=1 Tax=Candidatus Methanarcanum hacksteinii TaxID=2911857 RepID=UPI0037DDAAB0
MNSIQQLINKMCPDGVVFVPLSNITDYDQPSKYIVKSTNYDDKYSIPVLTAGQSFILGYTNETEGLFKASKENPVIIFDDFTTSMHWVDFDFKVKSSAMKMIKTKAGISQRYVYHCMKNITYKPVDHSRQWIEKYSQIKIPLPPLQIQEEIVRILDTFTELTAELTAELTLRKKQYEFYRDKLLSFDGLSEEEKINIGIRTIQFREFSIIERGNGLKKNDFSSEGCPCIHYGQIYTKFDTYVTKTPTKVPLEIAKGLKKVNTGDIIMAVTSENIEDVCKCVAWLGEETIVTGGHTAIIRTSENPKYLTYWFQSSFFYKQKIKLTHGTKVIEVTPTDLNEIVIQLPPKSVQDKIVNQLDLLHKYCTDLNEGLPAEINARQKQYEYYRDELLSFSESS